MGYKALLHFTTPIIRNVSIVAKQPFAYQNEAKTRYFLKKRHFFIKHRPLLGAILAKFGHFGGLARPLHNNGGKNKKRG